MHLDDKQIKNILINYIEEGHQKQPILITGEWGSGKTYFIKKVLKDLQDKYSHGAKSGKNVFMLSLYGIKSCDTLKNEIYSNLFGSYMNREGCEGKAEVVKNLEKPAKVLGKLMKIGLNSFNIKIEELAELVELIEIKGSVIIIDDLERCTIEISELMGFINNLAENEDVKIIIVANEDKFGNHLIESTSCSDRKTQNTLYLESKEKLIGLTINYCAPLSDVFESITNENIEGEAKEYLLSHKKDIINIFNSRGHYNIRTLLFTIKAFEKIFNIVNKINCDHTDLLKKEIENMLNYTIEIAIKFKSGDLIDHWDRVTTDIGDVFFKESASIKGYRFIDQYIKTYYIDANKVKSVIKEQLITLAEEEQNKEENKNLSLSKIRNWKYMEDDEIKEELKKIENEIKKSFYKLRDFNDILTILLQLKEVKFPEIDDDKIKKIVELMVLWVKSSNDNLDKWKLEFISENIDIKKKFDKVAKPIFEAIIEKDNNSGNVVNDIFKEDNNWGEKFVQICNENSGIFKESGRFLYNLDLNKMKQKLKNTLVTDIYDFMLGIKSIYDMVNIKSFYSADRENLEELISLIDVENFSCDKITKKEALKRLKAFLERKLNDGFERYETNKDENAGQ